MNWRIPVALGGTIAVLWAGDIDSPALLARVQSKVRDNAKNVPRYLCWQRIERRTFTAKSSRSCGTLPDQDADSPGPAFTLAVSDRARLDVMLASGSELFSWPGARSFQTDTPSDLLGGGLSGSGDFANFVISVFTLDRVTFEFLGACGAACVRYGYQVPQEVSGYVVKTALQQTVVGYRGTFDVDPQSADLIRITVSPTDLRAALPDACALQTKIAYSRTAMDAGEFSTPASTER
jgi:hypothetical protein